MNHSEIILYKTEDGAVKIDTIFQNETIWLTQSGMADLFDVKIPAISKHLKNIFESGELDEQVVVSGTEVYGITLENFAVLPVAVSNRTFCHEYLHTTNAGHCRHVNDEYNLMYYIDGSNTEVLRYRPETVVNSDGTPSSEKAHQWNDFDINTRTF